LETLFYKLMYDKRLKRGMTILEMLYKAKHDITIKDLEESLKISKKTVLTTLEFMGTLLPPALTLLVTERGVQLRNDGNQSIDAVIIEIAKQTISYQVLRYAFYDGDLNIRELAEKLYTSESTLRTRIGHMNKTLRMFACRLSFYDVKLIGNETNIRYLYYAYLSEFQELFISDCEEKLKYCSSIYENMKVILEKDHGKQLNYSYQQITRWMLITRDRMELGKFARVKREVIERIQGRDSYAIFKEVYMSELIRQFENLEIPESEIVWAYVVSFNSVIYLNTQEDKILYHDEADNQSDKEKISLLLEKMMKTLNIQERDKDDFLLMHMAYLLNLSLLTKISPIFQLGSASVKSYVVNTLEGLYTAWFQCLSDLDSSDLFPISNIYSMSAQLAMISSPFIYRQKTRVEKILYSFEGESGFPVYLEALARTLLPSGTEGVFIYNEPLTSALLKKIQPDIIVCNYQPFDKVSGYKVLRMSYIPQIQEWTLLKELIVNSNYDCSAKLDT
jgi:Transcriptional antiterminator